MAVVSPSVVGARSEMAVMSALHRAGMDVFVPICGAHSRTDLVTATEDPMGGGLPGRTAVTDDRGGRRPSEVR